LCEYLVFHFDKEEHKKTKKLQNYWNIVKKKSYYYKQKGIKMN